MIEKYLAAIPYGNQKKFQSPEGMVIKFFLSPNLLVTKIFNHPTLWLSSNLMQLWWLKFFDHHERLTCDIFLEVLVKNFPKACDMPPFHGNQKNLSPIDNVSVSNGEWIFSVAIQHTPIVRWWPKIFNCPKKAMGGRSWNSNKNKGKILARLSKGRKKGQEEERGKMGVGTIEKGEKTQGENEIKRKTKQKGG